MIKLMIYHKDVVENDINIPVYDFQSIYRVNILGGESGTGKTLFFSCLGKALTNQDDWYVECEKEIVLINNITNIAQQISSKKEAIFICDEDITHILLKRNLCEMISKSKNYFIFIDRGMGAFIDTNVRALFEVKRTNKIYEGIEIHKIEPYIKLKDCSNNINYSLFDTLITEDTASGRVFLSTMLDKLKIYNGPGGRSNVPSNIEDALNTTKGNILVAMDYDSCLNEMLLINRTITIDKSRISFIAMESFEEIICNTEFILQAFPEIRDRVINYEKYIDASYKHTGKYFSDLLFRYVKVKSPLKKDGDKNATKFYEKGMTNFKECFLDNCCTYGEKNCKLYTDADKKKLLLCNKFELLRPFSTVYD